jgi:hypothetical protein
MAINPERNTNYPYLNESDQDALEDIASLDSDTRFKGFNEDIAKCFDTFREGQIRIQQWSETYMLSLLAGYKEDISTAYRIYFECITIRQLPLSNPYRPSMANCKKQRDKLINEAKERYALGKKFVETRAAGMEIQNYDRLYSCIKTAQGNWAA